MHAQCWLNEGWLNEGWLNRGWLALDGFPRAETLRTKTS